jgi:DNA-directed RNA polymerase subunit beta
LPNQGERIDEALAKRLALGREVLIVPFVSDRIEYLSADAEDKFVIAQANAPLTEFDEFVRERISCRYHSGFIFPRPENLDYMDVAPTRLWVSAPR